MPRHLLVFLSLVLMLTACGEEPVGTGTEAEAGTGQGVSASPPGGGDADRSLAEQAAKLYAAGKYAEVVALVAPRQAAGRASLRLRVLLGRSLMYLEKPEEALVIARDIVAEDADHIEGNALLGELLLASGQAKEAIPALEVVLRRVQKPRWAVALGEAHLALGEAGKAKDRYEEALRLGSLDPTVHLALGRIYLERGYGSKAERAFRASAEAGGTEPELDLLRALALAAQDKWLAPLAAQRCPAARAPGSVAGETVVIRRLPGSADRAIVSDGPCALLFALRHGAAHPGDRRALLIVADAWLAAGNGEEAGKVLAVLGTGDDPPDLRRRHVRRLVLDGDPAALSTYLDELSADDGFPARELAGAWHRAAVLFRAEGTLAEARACLERADGIDPANETVLRSLAGLLAAGDDPAAAAAVLRRLVELVPDAEDIEELRRRLDTLVADQEVQ